MKHRQETVAEKDWDGRFGTYDEWARLGSQPPYRSATFTDAQGRRCITQQDFVRARDRQGSPTRGGPLPEYPPPTSPTPPPAPPRIDPVAHQGL
jgi:hypothetical protein